MARRVPNTSEAWTWRHAFAGAQLHATTKLLLHTVGMFMNEMGKGCFPSQAEIIEYSSLDKKTVIKHTRLAIDAGWLEAFQHGYRGQKWRRLEYKPCWPDRDLIAADAEPDLSEGGGNAPPPSDEAEVVELGVEGGGIEGSKVVEEVHQDKTFHNFPDSLPDGRAQARPGERGAGKADFQKRVQRLCNGTGFLAGVWKNWDEVSFDYIARHFGKLAPDEQAAAELWRDAYLLDIIDRKTNPMGLGNFLRDKAWQAMDPRLLDRLERHRRAMLPPGDRAKPDGWSPCLGPVGMAHLMATLLAGPPGGAPAPGTLWLEGQLQRDWPAVHEWKQVQMQRRGLVFGERWHAAKGLMEPVPQGTDMLAAWKRTFAERGWPWLAAFDHGDVVYLPAGGPEGLAEFERAVRGKDHDGDRQQAAE